jgi:hypothetical protein
MDRASGAGARENLILPIARIGDIWVFDGIWLMPLRYVHIVIGSRKIHGTMIHRAHGIGLLRNIRLARSIFGSSRKIGCWIGTGESGNCTNSNHG